MDNKSKTRPVLNDRELSSLVAGERVSLNLSQDKTVAAAYGGNSDLVKMFITRDSLSSVVIRYDATKVCYDGNGSVVLEEAESKKYENLGEVPGSEYLLLIRAGLVRE